MTKAKSHRFGALSPQYRFMLNPYPDIRVSRCPLCGDKTGQRKVPLLIHVDPAQLIALNFTCRYCRKDDLLIAHKDETEHILAEQFLQRDPSVVGNPYIILGTMEKKAWRGGLHRPIPISELRAHTHDFKAYLGELRVSWPGWYPKGVEPAVREPPASDEWVKPGGADEKKRKR